MAYNPITIGSTNTANSQAVVLPTDQVAIPTITAASTTGGVTAVTGSSVGGSALINAIPQAAQVYGWYFYNANTVAAYVGFYNIASGGTTTSTLFYCLVIPPVSGANVFGIGITHTVGASISIATTRPGGSTAMSSAVDYTIFYK